MKYRLLLGAVLTVLALNFAALFAGPKASKSSTLAAHDTWRKLWEDHITWTRTVIMSVLDTLPGNDFYVQRLLQNATDMENALRPYYGQGADEFGDLVTDHLLIAAQILTAARDGDTAAQEDAIARWYENGHEI